MATRSNSAGAVTPQHCSEAGGTPLAPAGVGVPGPATPHTFKVTVLIHWPQRARNAHTRAGELHPGCVGAPRQPRLKMKWLGVMARRGRRRRKYRQTVRISPLTHHRHAHATARIAVRKNFSMRRRRGKTGSEWDTCTENSFSKPKSCSDCVGPPQAKIFFASGQTGQEIVQSWRL